MFLFQKIEELTIQYHDAKKNVAEFLLNEKSNVQHFSMQQIADMTYTSKPTLVRFAQSLGFSGWKEFIEEFIKEAHYQETHFLDIDPNLPFLKTDGILEIAHKLSKLQMESIQDTVDMMEEKTIEEAGDMLLKARHIVLFGISPNTILGELFKRKMESIKILMNISSVDESGMLSHSLTPQDCAIIVSYSGNNENREPMRFIKTLKDHQVPMIGITSGGNNYIRENIDCVFSVSSRERLFTKISGFATEESINFIFNTLFSYCFAKNYKDNYIYKVQNSVELENRRRASLKEMKDDPDSIHQI